MDGSLSCKFLSESLPWLGRGCLVFGDHHFGVGGISCIAHSHEGVGGSGVRFFKTGWIAAPYADGLAGWVVKDSGYPVDNNNCFSRIVPRLHDCSLLGQAGTQE